MVVAGSSSMTNDPTHTARTTKEWLRKKHFMVLEWPSQSQTWTNRKSMEEAETLCCPATAPKPERSGEDLYGKVGQNPCCSVLQTWSRKLQETSDLCNCKQRFRYQILSSIFSSCIKYLFHAIKWKLIIYKSYNVIFRIFFVSHSWGVPTMKITDLSILCKWETLKNRLCIKYLFAPLYIRAVNLLKYLIAFNRIDCHELTCN